MKIRYYVTRQRRGCPKYGYWQPCLARPHKITGVFEPTLMAKLGFKHVDCGVDGPLAWAVAESWNRKWDEARNAHRLGVRPESLPRIYPPDSLGEGFYKFRATGEWKQMKPRTKEGWLRGWKYIDPTFGDVNPRTVALEHVDLWYHGDANDAAIEGILQKHGVGESYIAMKYWRAIWAKLKTINRADGERYCVDDDPSLGIRRKTPKARNAMWFYDEAQIIITGAGKHGFDGLQAALAVAWDTLMSPVDVRTLTLAELTGDDPEGGFRVDRTKTGKDTIATLTADTQALIKAYIDGLGVTLHPDSPVFRTRGAAPGPKGGRPRAPVPYTKDTLSKDFRKVLALVMPGEDRKVMDFRRSGALEAVAGQVNMVALATKMGNSIDTDRKLQKTYLPGQVAIVNLADEARARGREVLRDTKTGGAK